MISVNGEVFTKEHVAELIVKHGLPHYMAECVFMYVNHGILPGGFLTALLSNDLEETVAHADTNNRRCISDWVKFLYSEMPAGSFGSVSAVREWRAKRVGA